MKTFEEFRTDILNMVAESPKYWRYGQSVFNIIDAMGYARSVQSDDMIDCFYDDTLVDAFIHKAYEKYKTCNIQNNMENNKPKYKVGDVVTYTYDSDGKQYTFSIVDIQEECIYDDANEYTTFVYYDSVPGTSRSFLTEEDIDGLARESVKITKESLIADGWDYEQDYDQYYHYSKAIDNPKNSKWKFYLEIRPGSNTVGRDWYLHVDNNCFESVGTMDVANFGQIDRFIELLSE